jgi:hypothetical protein
MDRDGNKISSLLRLGLVALAGFAVVQELRKPATDRQWHGKVGPIPYDFRMPTMERIRARLWSPDAAILQPQVFGVGWTVNLAALLRRLGIGGGDRDT